MAKQLILCFRIDKQFDPIVYEDFILATYHFIFDTKLYSRYHHIDFKNIKPIVGVKNIFKDTNQTKTENKLLK